MNRFFNKTLLVLMGLLLYPFILYNLIRTKAPSFSKDPLDFINGINDKLDIASTAMKQPTIK